MIFQDAIATLITFAIALGWLASINFIASRGWIQSTLSRKIIHIGTGPLFVLSWPIFSDAFYARYLAASVPFILTLVFLATGLGVIDNPKLVQSSTRNGMPRELLRGPLYYGIAFVICTLVFWRTSPAGIVALMVMCGGDGLADVFGRRWGSRKLPFSEHKSWVGSIAMFVGSFLFSFGYLMLFDGIGYIHLSLSLAMLAGRLGIICFIATLIEALPFPDIDNITLTVTVIGLTLWLL